MSNNSCGCGGNNSGGTSPPAVAPSPSASPCYTQPAGGPECAKSHCDAKFAGLSFRNGIQLMGVLANGCFRVLASKVRGIVVNDPSGESYSTNYVDVPLPENAEWQRNSDGSLVYQGGHPVKTNPPAFPFLMGFAQGFWSFISGKSGINQVLEWNGSQWALVDKPDPSGKRPQSDYPQATTPCGVELLGLKTASEEFTDGCGNVAQRPVSTLNRLAYVPALVGEIKAWGGNTNAVPAGYLFCDGRVLSKTIYPDLFSVLGYNWGGSGDSFQIPDMRGRFLRGADAGSGRDPQPNRTVGSYQGDAVIQHTHAASSQQTDSPEAKFTLGTTSAKQPEEGDVLVNVYSNTSTLGDETISAVVQGIILGVTVGSVTETGETPITSTETRPKNAAVNYLIYAGCVATP